MKKPVHVAVTGAAGNIGYALTFRIAAGDMLGPDQPVILHLIEIPPVLPALEGVVMELKDCAFPLLDGVIPTADLREGFEGVDFALLVGARPRGAGMERKDLLGANGAIFAPQGKALSEHANRDVRVLVVGNPANTNCLIALSNAPQLDRRQFTAMTRLDHNRAVSQLAAKTGAHPKTIKRMTIWGNHSTTQFPDIQHATVDSRPAPELVDQEWYRTVFIPTVQQRGAAVIKARGASSAASASSSALDHMRCWMLGTPPGDWVSMGVPADGSYGVPEGVVYSYPCVCEAGQWKIVQGLDCDGFAGERMAATDRELREERAAIEELVSG